MSSVKKKTRFLGQYVIYIFIINFLIFSFYYNDIIYVYVNMFEIKGGYVGGMLTKKLIIIPPIQIKLLTCDIK